MIPVLRPSYTDAEAIAVGEVLRSGWTGLGPKVAEFEAAFASHLGVKHAIAVNSCTSALHLAMRLVGVEQGGAVLCPSLTFVSTAHVARHCGAKPVFVDIDRTTLMMDQGDIARKALRQHGNIDAIAFVLYAGQPPHFDVSRSFPRFPVIYDCAHACGSTFDARGKLCCWSFHAVKNLSCGEGGMLTTDDDRLADRARRLRWMGISTSTYDRNYATGLPRTEYKWEYDVDEIGWKYNMHDISAAIGLVQLRRLPEMQAKRVNLVQAYLLALADIPEVQPFEHLEGSAYHLMVIRCPERNALHAHLKAQGISSGVHYKPIHIYRCYGYQDPLPATEEVSQTLLTLPLFVDMTIEQVVQVCDAIRQFYKQGYPSDSVRVNGI